MDVPLFKFGFYFTFILNFVFPFFVLMTRRNKRRFGILAFASIVLIGGHYLDFWMMVMPGANMPHHHEEHAEEGHGDEHHEETAHFNEGMDKHSEEAPVVLAAEHSEDAHGEEGHGEGAHGDDHHGEEKEKLTYAGLGIPELFMFLGFVGAFLFVVFTAMSKGNLVPVNDVFLKESKQHHI
jgi:hypothetical protein